ncbi:MAG: Sec-independent protein translocase protein TatB [Actinomycetota bacterium]|nr:Sec-independent protein translocase protein TatB [Actinomycetota bacterium]
MFDIGIGEILIVAVIGLLVFGPERLPRAAADAARWIKQMRVMATGARKDLADSAGLDLGDTVSTVKSLQEFHPRRLAAGLFSDDQPDPAASDKPAGPAAGPRPAFDPDAT